MPLATLLPPSDSGNLAALHRKRADQVLLAASLAGLCSTVPAQYQGRARSISEGRTFRVSATGGTVQLRVFDALKAEAAANRAADRPALPPPPVGSPAKRIGSWSRRSRSRMLRTFAGLDYSAMLSGPGTPAMVTLTYPGDWQAACPTPQAAKAHMRALMERWQRAAGARPPGLWKLEFQRRGAPHFHLFAMVPAQLGGVPFRQWLSEAWAEVVHAPDPDERARHLAAGTRIDRGTASRSTDPKRLAVYFLKHGTKTHDGKEYQNQPPPEWAESPSVGRFWGYWQLRPIAAAVDVDVDTFIQVRRLWRRWARAKMRRRRMASGSLAGGWLLVNDPARFCADTGRAVQLQRGSVLGPVREQRDLTVAGLVLDPVEVVPGGGVPAQRVGQGQGAGGHGLLSLGTGRVTLADGFAGDPERIADLSPSRTG